MDHIRQHDWCNSTPDIHFVDEYDLDNCVIEKILRNKFRDPLISSDSESDTPNNIDWDSWFTKELPSELSQRYVPGLRPLPPYPKVSSLTAHQHEQCLKVLCAQNPHILETEFLPRPTKQDHGAFDELKDKYAAEQKEYLEWAKLMWVNDHCVRALRPKPAVETVYEADFKLRAQRLQGFPRNLAMAAQIPLETAGSSCELEHLEDLINVNIAELPQIQLPELIVKKVSIVRPLPMPKPCNKHPCRFVLPNESSMSVLPLPELNRELAQYAAERGARCVASEAAVRCLLQHQRRWILPLSVCTALSPEGEELNVVVLASEFANRREAPPVRTYRAYRQLLEYALIPSTEKLKLQERGKAETTKPANPAANNSRNDTSDNERDNTDSSDDENNSLVIDTAGDTEINENQSDNGSNKEDNLIENSNGKNNGVSENNGKASNKTERRTNRNVEEERVSGIVDDIGIYTCSCADADGPAPRSFSKWRVKNTSSREQYDLIVHCSHKVRDDSGEVIVEPIPEYQLELGGSAPAPDARTGLELAALLRNNASLLSVRVCGTTGDIVTCERGAAECPPGPARRAAAALFTALNQLQGLLPGDYVLQHEPHHGANALLFASSRAAASAQTLRLDLDCGALSNADDASAVKTPPVLTPALLPYHKSRRILPCAFSPHAHPAPRARAPRPPHRHRPPPGAIRRDAEAASGAKPKWPKRKHKKKKKRAD